MPDLESQINTAIALASQKLELKPFNDWARNWLEASITQKLHDQIDDSDLERSQKVLARIALDTAYWYHDSDYSYAKERLEVLNSRLGK